MKLCSHCENAVASVDRHGQPGNSLCLACQAKGNAGRAVDNLERRFANSATRQAARPTGLPRAYKTRRGTWAYNHMIGSGRLVGSPLTANECAVRGLTPGPGND